MKVRELIEILQKCNQDYVVKYNDQIYISSVTQMTEVGVSCRQITGHDANRVSLK